MTSTVIIFGSAGAIVFMVIALFLCSELLDGHKEGFSEFLERRIREITKEKL